jgi:hypothetical protein
MAKKNAKSKSDRKEESCANVLDKLDSAEAASVLGKLLDRHSELRSEAEAIASDMLTEISPDSVADEIEEALLQFDYDDLNGRAGSHIATDVRDTFWAEGEHQEHSGANAARRSVDHLEVLSAEHPRISEEGRRGAGSRNPEEGKAAPQGD